MKTAVRWAILVVACLAMSFSLAPTTAHAIVTPQNPNPGGDAGSGGATWQVTCSYDSHGHLIGKICASGGRYTCACP